MTNSLAASHALYDKLQADANAGLEDHKIN
jgi:hypothetical protein